MLYLKYVIFTDERKSITVAAKNVTLSAELFFSHNGILQKNTSEPLQGLGFLPITDGHQMLHWCNILRRIFLKTNNQIEK